MKICFYCESVFTFGGVQRVLAVVASALARHHEVTILTHDPLSDADTTLYGLDQSGIRFEYMHYPPMKWYEYLPCKLFSLCYKNKLLPQNRTTSRWYGYSSFPHSQRVALLNQLNGRGFDAVIGVHAFISLKLASLRPKLDARKVIGWMHTSYESFFLNPGYYLWKQKVQFQFEMRRLDDIVVLSDTDRAMFLQHMDLPVTTIYNPLTLTPGPQSRLDGKRFLGVGRLSHQTKGFDLLIEAFALLAREEKEWTLDIVGEGPEEEFLRGLIVRHGLNERVKIHPFDKHIESYYSAASVFVLSSRWEGFPLVLAEAMSHGLPLIASRLPIVRELLEGKGNTLVFKNKDVNELAACLRQFTTLPPDALREMGDTSLKIAGTLQPEAILEKWEEVIE